MPQMRADQAGHLAERPALAELLEAAELGDVEAGVGHVTGVVEEDADLRVPLDAGDGVDDDALRHFSSPINEPQRHREHRVKKHRETETV